MLEKQTIDVRRFLSTVINKLIPFLLLLPFLIVIMFFLAGLFDGIIQGFGYIPAFNLKRITLHYFVNVLSDKYLLASIGSSLYIAFTSAVISIFLATFISYCLVTLKKEHGVFGIALQIPMFVPWMTTALLTMQMFSGSGWIARFFYAIGLENAAAALSHFLYQPNQLGIIVAFVWACTPFGCYFLLTVMSNINSSFVEAASTLGSDSWRAFWNVTFPLCLPSIKNIFLIFVITCFGNYEIPMLLGMTMPRTLPVEIYYQYLHFDLAHRPFALALNTILISISVAIAFVINITVVTNDTKVSIRKK
ncbi:MAG: ABC transporter permease subunit [Termitinemataceae bacterium]|nr:MAG: ABC transporter permease subunit [Termitinemataceae bacterium]